jgi:acetoin utilization protein AcuB
VTRVDEVMSRQVVTIGADTSGHDAVQALARHKIRHLPVVDREGRLAGIVTDRDLRHHLFEPEVFRAIGTEPVERLLSQVPVSAVMSSPVTSIAADAGLDEAARVMREAGLGSLPVVERGRIVGIVTETDVLRHIVGADACCAEVETIVVSYP